MSRAWLGLGGNIGDVEAAMASALRRLDAEDGIAVTAVSALYKTPPWGVTDQPWFLNCCAEIETSLSPQNLLKACQAAEHAGKRERKIRWGPRTIDIDVLMFEGVESDDKALTLPHPRMHERAFVLLPLAEIAAGEVLRGRLITEWAAAIDGEDVERLVVEAAWWR